MLKAELHSHVKGDPKDDIPYTWKELIDRLAALDYDIVAITPHTKVFESDEAITYAESLGILLIQGIEARIAGCDVLIYNCGSDAADIRTFEELEAYRSSHPETLVIAPHPFFPYGVGRTLTDRPWLFDAWEWSTYYSRIINLNRKMARLAPAFDKPIVGTGDIHDLRYAGCTYTLLDAQRTVQGVIEAIRSGAVEYRTTPLSTWNLVTMFAPSIPSHLLQRLSAR